MKCQQASKQWPLTTKPFITLNKNSGDIKMKDVVVVDAIRTPIVLELTLRLKLQREYF